MATIHPRTTRPRVLSLSQRGRLWVGVALASLMMLASVGPASAAAPTLGQWHRNNYNTGHERLTCREAAPSWTCFYESDIPEAGTTGWFSGRNVTDSWTCPDWFPSDICDNVTAVYEGVAVYIPSVGGHAFTVRQHYIVTDLEGQAVLQLYWDDQFVCPWYRTFEEALAADFNCVFAP